MPLESILFPNIMRFNANIDPDVFARIKAVKKLHEYLEKEPIAEEKAHARSRVDFVAKYNSKTISKTAMITILSGWNLFSMYVRGSIHGLDIREHKSNDYAFFVCLAFYLSCIFQLISITSLSSTTYKHKMQMRNADDFINQRSIDYRAIITAIEKLTEKPIEISAEYICLITSNIVTNPVCIYRKTGNEKIEGVFNRDALGAWLRDRNNVIPQTNETFDEKLHEIRFEGAILMGLKNFILSEIDKYEKHCLNGIAVQKVDDHAAVEETFQSALTV
ncbi:MAG: hypothetical protein Q8L78_02450 [Coxiellaceae bacterium]|nr:hypothetical protein [Coxiellaceae bacterium]